MVIEQCFVSERIVFVQLRVFTISPITVVMQSPRSENCFHSYRFLSRRRFYVFTRYVTPARNAVFTGNSAETTRALCPLYFVKGNRVVSPQNKVDIAPLWFLRNCR